MNDINRLKKLLKYPEGREIFYSELGDYKNFITFEEINAIAPAILNWLD